MTVLFDKPIDANGPAITVVENFDSTGDVFVAIGGATAQQNGNLVQLKLRDGTSHYVNMPAGSVSAMYRLKVKTGETLAVKVGAQVGLPGAKDVMHEPDFKL